jgi:uncharacterized protein YuzE
MTHYIGLNVDLETQVGYIRYRALPAGERARSERVSADVAVDYGGNGAVLGLELLALDEEALAQAKEFAGRHDLAFPLDLTGAVGQA